MARQYTGSVGKITNCQIGVFAAYVSRHGHAFNSWGKPFAVAGTAKDIAQNLPADAWRRLSAGTGTKGERLHDWADLELADLDACDFDARFSGFWTRGLLIRRSTTDGDLAFFSTWCLQDRPMETLIRVEGHRWAIEDSFETAKNELGLDHNETRSWHGWHRHVSLVMLAFAMMAAIRHHANVAPPQKQSARRIAATDPLVRSGNPTYREPPRPKPNQPGPYHRLVALETGTSGLCAAQSFQDQNATVMLVVESGFLLHGKRPLERGKRGSGQTA